MIDGQWTVHYFFQDTITFIIQTMFYEKDLYNILLSQTVSREFTAHFLQCKFYVVCTSGTVALSVNPSWTIEPQFCSQLFDEVM